VGTTSASQWPDLSGKTALITGANSGLGYETAKAMAAHGARIIMACRNTQKADEATAALGRSLGEVTIEVQQLDLADPESISAFCDRILERETGLQYIINNAGLGTGQRKLTKAGHELHFGTNHLGHFAMNARLLPLVEAVGGRVVGLGSLMHKMVWNWKLDDVNWSRRKFNTSKAYAESKLANMLYIHELGKRLEAKNSTATAVMAHPGFSSSNIMTSADAASFKPLEKVVARASIRLFGQSSARGAEPTLLAATDPGARQGDYYGPTGWREIRGAAGKVRTAKNARDDKNAAALWALSEEMTGQPFTV